MDAICNKQFKARFVSCVDYAHDIQGACCVLPISVGQYYVEGNRFSSMIELVNRSFSRCDIIIIDILQRHTLQLKQDIDTRHSWQAAIENGQQWRERNNATIDHLTIPHNIRYWSEWLYDDTYLERRQLIDQLYEDNPVIQQAFNKSAEKFMRRYLSRRPELAQKKQYVFDTCMQYIKEECSIMSLWVKEGYEFEVYPGKRVPGMQAIYELIVKPKHPNLLRWLQVNMRSIKPKAASPTDT